MSAAGWARLAARLGVAHPIVQAPMAGGGDTPALVAAVSEAGGLGSIGAAYLSPEQIAAAVAEVRRRTRRPFAVNLFAGGATEGAEDAAPMLGFLARWYAELGLALPEIPPPPRDRFGEQLEAVLAAGVGAFSFTFGIPDPAALAELRRRDVVVMGTATTVGEARALEAAGVDAVVAQGSEAGGHRGTFSGPFEAALVGTLALVPQVVDAVSLPVVAAGGIMDGRGVVAARALGAAGVQLGTAFLACRESGIADAYRAALLAGRDDATVVTRAFSGRPARGLRNRFHDEVEAAGVPIPPFPVQNSLTRPLRTAAAAQGRADALSAWAGQGVGLARPGGAAELVARLVEEADALSRDLARAAPGDRVSLHATRPGARVASPRREGDIG